MRCDHAGEYSGRRARLLLRPAPERAAATISPTRRYRAPPARLCRIRRQSRHQHVGSATGSRNRSPPSSRRDEMPRHIHARSASAALRQHASGHAWQAQLLLEARRWSLSHRQAGVLDCHSGFDASASAVDVLLVEGVGPGLSRSNTPMQRSSAAANPAPSEPTDPRYARILGDTPPAPLPCEARVADQALAILTAPPPADRRRT